MTACPLDCASCPALARCGGTSNLCLLGRCGDCQDHPLLRMEVRRTVMRQLGGLDLVWPRPLRHHPVAELPAHLPVLIQAYADPVDVPWVALHAGRVLGVTGTRVTPKHRRPLHEVYRLSADTRLALEFYVEDRVLEGVWLHRRSIVPQLAELGFDLVLSPNVSVWRAESRLTVIWNNNRGRADDGAPSGSADDVENDGLGPLQVVDVVCVAACASDACLRWPVTPSSRSRAFLGTALQHQARRTTFVARGAPG